MARKQFVSSKKNAPSRVVSSKEAALHGRGATAVDAENDDEEDEEDEEEEEDDDDDNDASGDSDTGSNSPASSNGSSDELDVDADATAPSPTAVAVEVVPASVGRGKQLRFPTVISRGKESRVFGHGDDKNDKNDKSDKSDDDDDSDSDDSLLSLGSDEEDDDTGSKESAQVKQTTSKNDSEDVSMLEAGGTETEKPQDDDAGGEYPIKAFRARKRHRPDSGYYQQMSTYVRDCLLSVRGSGDSAVASVDVLSEASHDEFRRKLSAGTVERVVWKETLPLAVEQPAESVVKSEKVKTKTKKTTTKTREDGKEATTPAEQVKKEKPRKETRTIKMEPTTSTNSSSTSSSSRNHNNNTSSSSTTTTASSTSNGAAVKVEAGKEKSVVLPTPTPTPTSTPTPTPSESVLCSSCKRKLSDVKDAAKPPPAPKKSVTIVAPETRAESRPQPSASVPSVVVASRPPPAPAPVPPAAANRAAVEPQGSFIIPTAGTRDVQRLRAEADRLNEEARALKHEGNDRGAADAGAAGQIAQGKCYLRSSAKYFQNALKLADIKAAYKELGNEPRAQTFGGYCLTTLTQTSSLIESTIRVFQAAGSRRMVALAYKFSAIAHLTIYRLQHTKLLSFYSDLFTPGRSPETRQNGTPTPPSGTTSVDSREAAMRTLLLKEMEHTLRGFEMWRRYEACNIVVLPRVSNPATTDLAVLFEELSSELGRA